MRFLRILPSFLPFGGGFEKKTCGADGGCPYSKNIYKAIGKIY
jgi:hypothetical protein